MSESRGVPVRPPAIEAAPVLGRNQTRQRSYQASDETLKVLDELRGAFQLATDSAVIRRSLALARVVVRAAEGAGSIVILRRDGTDLEIMLRD